MTEREQLTHEQLIRLAKERAEVVLTQYGDRYELLVTSTEKPIIYILDRYLAFLVVDWIREATIYEKDGVKQRSGELDESRLGPLADL